MSAYHTERMRSKEVIFHHQVGNSFNLTIIAEDKCERGPKQRSHFRVHVQIELSLDEYDQQRKQNE
jgi:hypothetical protein